MRRVYSVNLETSVWYPGNYEDKVNVHIETEDKKLTEYLEEKVLLAIKEYKRDDEIE